MKNITKNKKITLILLFQLFLSGCNSSDNNQQAFKNTKYDESHKAEIKSTQAISEFGAANKFLDKGDYKNAIYHYAISANLNPETPDAWSALAHAHYLNGDFKEAEKNWVKALGVKPGDIISLTGLASLYGKTGRDELALSTYREILNINPKSDGANWNLSQFYIVRKNYDRAIPHLKIVTKHTKYRDLREKAKSQLNKLKELKAQAV